MEKASTKSIGCRWLYKTKHNPDGTVGYKGRVVIKGYEQVKGPDLNETYAPISKFTTLRYLLSFAAQNGWKLDHLNVITMFLNPEIDAALHMERVAISHSNRACAKNV